MSKFHKILQETITEIEQNQDIDMNTISGYENYASEDACIEILEKIKILAEKETKIENLPMSQIVTATALLLQTGATSPSTPANKKIQIAKTKITAEMLRRACKSINNTTPRQFARGISNEIVKIMLNLGDKAPEGNLARTMKLELDACTKKELIWASDFNTYNDNCPKRVKQWLIKNYQDKFKKIK